jgi:hypothetical protein
MPTLLSCTDDAKVRALADDIRTKLPRELRDIIYSFIWDECTVQDLDLPQILTGCDRDLACSGSARKCKPLPAGAPAIVKKAIVGQCIAAEAIEWLYRNSYSLEIGTPEQLPRFFRADLFGVDVFAEDYLLHKLTVTIEMPDFLTCNGLFFCFIPIFAGKLRDSFELTIRIYQRKQNTLGLADLVDLNRPLYVAVVCLQDQGIQVHVNYENVDGLKWDIVDILGRPLGHWIRTLLCKLSRVSQLRAR